VTTDPGDHFYARENKRFIGEGIEIHRWRVRDLWQLAEDIPAIRVPVWNLRQCIKPHMWVYQDQGPNLLEAFQEALADLGSGKEDPFTALGVIQMLLQHVFREVSDPAAALTNLVERVDRVRGVDPRWPIIMSAEWDVMDGRHRLARLLLDGEEKVFAQVFDKTPPPTEVLRSDSKVDYLQGEFEVLHG